MKKNVKNKNSPFSRALSKVLSEELNNDEDQESIDTSNQRRQPEFGLKNTFNSHRASNRASFNPVAMSLRALFGTSKDLDVNELLDKASSLKNIVSVSLLSKGDVRALDTIYKNHLGLKECGDLQLICSAGEINFIGGQKSTLVVVTNGPFAPGMKEALDLIAQRIEELQ